MRLFPWRGNREKIVVYRGGKFMKTLIILGVLITCCTAKAPEFRIQEHPEIQKITLKIDHLTEGSRPNNKDIAKLIWIASNKHKVETEVLLALFMVESTFTQNKISKTGDMGIGQINPGIWKEEFLRRGLKSLDVARLQSDTQYAVDRTAEILSLLKKAGYKNYYGVYHSKTKELRKIYTKRIHKQLVKLKEFEEKKSISLAVSKNP